MSMLFNSNSAAQFYNAAKALSQSQKQQPTQDMRPEKADFGDVLKSAAQETLDALKTGEKTAMDSITGKADAHSVVEALATTEMAVQSAITVRDRVVEAYQEILRMPV
jgi:flagellar hook-basal body complex protein FliE